MPLGVGGGLRSTNDFQNAKEAFLSQDRYLKIISWRYDQKLSVWLSAPLLVFGGGLCSTDEFINVMVTPLARVASW